MVGAMSDDATIDPTPHVTPDLDTGMLSPAETAEERPVASIDIPAEDGAVTERRLDPVRDVKVIASAEVGRAEVRIEDVMKWSVGTIVELDHPADQPLPLFVNGKQVAEGEVVVSDEKLSLRITKILSRRPQPIVV